MSPFRSLVFLLQLGKFRFIFDMDVIFDMDALISFSKPGMSAAFSRAAASLFSKSSKFFFSNPANFDLRAATSASAACNLDSYLALASSSAFCKAALFSVWSVEIFEKKLIGARRGVFRRGEFLCVLRLERGDLGLVLALRAGEGLLSGGNIGVGARAEVLRFEKPT